MAKKNKDKPLNMPCDDLEGCKHFKVEVAQGEYIKLLQDELDDVAGLAYAHGWRSTRGDEGKRLRKLIKQALTNKE